MGSRLRRPDPDPALAVHGSGELDEVLPRSGRDPADCTLTRLERSNSGLRIWRLMGVGLSDSDVGPARLGEFDRPDFAALATLHDRDTDNLPLL